MNGCERLDNDAPLRLCKARSDNVQLLQGR